MLGRSIRDVALDIACVCFLFVSTLAGSWAAGGMWVYISGLGIYLALCLRSWGIMASYNLLIIYIRCSYGVSERLDI